MAEPAQIARLGQDGHSIDRTNAGGAGQKAIIGQFRHQAPCPILDLVALAGRRCLHRLPGNGCQSAVLAVETTSWVLDSS
jgi:hypothetical protein